MIPWIQVYSNIPTHDKTYALAEKLKIPNYAAVGLMVSLWAWASINAADGDISRYPPRAIADATGYATKKPEEFYTALVDTRLIEVLEDGRTVIRNWEEYAALLIDLMETQKKKTADRVRKHRERQKQKGKKTDCNVTETLSNAYTPPYTTLPLSPNGESNNLFDVVGDKGRTQSVEVVDDFVENRSLSLDAYLGMTDQIKAEAQKVTASIFAEFTSRAPTQQDVVNVFSYTFRHLRKEGDQYTDTFDKDAINLLLYAFQQSTLAGCPGKWAYISGVIRNLNERGIKTLEEAEGYDFERDQKKGRW